MNFLVAKNLGFLPFFHHLPHKNIRSERKYRHEISSSNVETTVGCRKGGQWPWRWREILASMGALNLTSVLWKAIQWGVNLTLPKKWVLQWSNIYSNTSKSIGCMSQKSILRKKKQSQQKKKKKKKQKAWFSKPRTNYRDRSKLPQRFCPTISCIIEFPAILLIYIWYLKQSPILICRY